jgi:hypothetical protein
MARRPTRPGARHCPARDMARAATAASAGRLSRVRISTELSGPSRRPCGPGQGQPRQARPRTPRSSPHPMPKTPPNPGSATRRNVVRRGVDRHGTCPLTKSAVYFRGLVDPICGGGDIGYRFPITKGNCAITKSAWVTSVTALTCDFAFSASLGSSDASPPNASSSTRQCEEPAKVEWCSCGH